jgi:hypothetical protein
MAHKQPSTVNEALVRPNRVFSDARVPNFATPSYSPEPERLLPGEKIVVKVFGFLI